MEPEVRDEVLLLDVDLLPEFRADASSVYAFVLPFFAVASRKLENSWTNSESWSPSIERAAPYATLIP